MFIGGESSLLKSTNERPKTLVFEVIDFAAEPQCDMVLVGTWSGLCQVGRRPGDAGVEANVNRHSTQVCAWRLRHHDMQFP